MLKENSSPSCLAITGECEVNVSNRWWKNIKIEILIQSRCYLLIQANVGNVCFQRLFLTNLNFNLGRSRAWVKIFPIWTKAAKIWTFPKFSGILRLIIKENWKYFFLEFIFRSVLSLSDWKVFSVSLYILFK